MDYLKINFEEMRFGAMRSSFESLERGFRQFDIDYYLIGAFARDLWMNHIETLPVRRTTLDVDFSIYISSHDTFIALKDYLKESEGFQADKEPYRLHAPDETIIDLIPFGGIERDHMVYLEGSPPMDLSVFGNMQVLAHAANIQLNGVDFKICTLPGLCILKLIASHEKPERLAKDLGDFYYILENYFEIAGDTIYESEYEDLIDEDFVPLIAAAKMLGRQLLPILNDSAVLKNTFAAILDKLKQGFLDPEIDQMYLHEPADQQIKRIKLVSILQQEITSR
jgi:predicted nucleotidyltransferase